MFPMTFHNYVHQVGTTNTGGRGPSPNLWSKWLGLTSSPDGGDQAVAYYDDFLNFGGAVASNIQGTNGYKTFEDNSCSITQRAIGTYDGGAGVIRMVTTTTDNAEVNIQSGYSTGTLGAISDTAGDDFPLAFECRVMFTQVTDTYNFFIGLAEEGLAVTDGMITDAGAMTDKDFIGYQVLEADGDSLVAFYNKASGTDQSVVTTAIAASTWYKLGFLYDPTAPASERIAFYIDNVRQSTFVTATAIATANFPDAQGLAFAACVKNQTNVAKSVDIDWWAFGQARLASS